MKHLWVAATALALISCTTEKQSGCTPGQSSACACTSGKPGAQVCRADHTFDACICDDTPGSPDLAEPGDPSMQQRDAGANDLAQAVTAGEKRVFVTSTAYYPHVLATVCQDSAKAASLGGTWKAWLSKAWSTGNEDAIDQIQGDGPWKLLTGEVAFANHGQLATKPSVYIDVDENGIKQTGVSVWTGTLTGGRASGAPCDNWRTNSASYQAVVGVTSPSTGTTTQFWTHYLVKECNGVYRVYCFEQ